MISREKYNGEIRSAIASYLRETAMFQVHSVSTVVTGATTLTVTITVSRVDPTATLSVAQLAALRGNVLLNTPLYFPDAGVTVTPAYL